MQNTSESTFSSSLKPLPHPVYFITKDEKWQPLMENPELATDDSLYELCTTSEDIYSAETFMNLKRRGLDVHLVSSPVPGKICVIPYFYITPKEWLFKSYVVACRYDCPESALCHHEIVVNHLLVRSNHQHFLPTRPQPDLKPRSLSRGTRVENLVFKGHSFNLVEPFRSPEFLATLENMGITLQMSTEDTKSRFREWADYSEADVVIAVRNNTLYDITLKPALKLINAWFAGCPAILGPEPAYQKIRRSELDFFEVRTSEEAIAALEKLKANPKLYQAMVENGFERARDYTVDHYAAVWRDLLAGPIATGYERWLQESVFQKQLVRPAMYAGQIVKHRMLRKYYYTNIHKGKRILEVA